jgi:hypothetical protein
MISGAPATAAAIAASAPEKPKSVPPATMFWISVDPEGT